MRDLLAHGKEAGFVQREVGKRLVGGKGQNKGRMEAIVERNDGDLGPGGSHRCGKRWSILIFFLEGVAHRICLWIGWEV